MKRMIMASAHKEENIVTSNSYKALIDGAIDFTSGTLGAVALVYVGQPLDTVKVKMQTFPHMYRGMWDCMRQTVRYEGLLRGLYAGTVPALVANCAENSVLFAAYGACQKAVAYVTNTPRVEDLGALGNATAGCLGSFFSSFTLCPTELIKVQLQAAREFAIANNQKVRIGAFKLTRHIIQTEGVSGMFRGLGSTIAREMPGYFVFFGGYEATRSMLTPPGKTKEECGTVPTMIAGAVGGFALWTVIFPADLVKSRIQVNCLDGTFLSVTLDIIKKEGVKALYSGLRPTLIRTIPATAVLFLVYENSKHFLNSLVY
uniref:Mitochondrial ornithine transporter 1 n=1 Tax=Homalodisca liturata TaxID=320908 RepID=A0A1B6IJU5_9HEMI